MLENYITTIIKKKFKNKILLITKHNTLFDVVNQFM